MNVVGRGTVTRAYVSLGSNLGDREDNLAEALARLAELSGIRVTATSRIYETEPVGFAEQPWFLNQVAALDTSLDADELLSHLLEIENEMGRVRTIRFGPRCIDLDLLTFGEDRVATERLQVPHPRMWERLFVLAPLAEIAPGVMGPGGASVSEMVQAFSGGPRVKLYKGRALDDVERKLIELFGSGEGFISGEELADKLGITRAAVWKRIKALRARGFTFDAVPHLGYRIAAWPDRVVDFGLGLGPRTREGVVGCRVHLLETVDSTNACAKRLGAAGAPAGTVVLAESQAAGRGRRGRSWSSRPGLGVWLSVILRPALPMAMAPRFTPLTAVAVVRTLRAFDVPCGIKWPNDIVCGQRKCGGILLEVSGDMEQVDFLVLGVGLNINHGEEDFPPEVATVATSARLAVGRQLDRFAIVRRLMAELEVLRSEAEESGFARIMDEYGAALVTLGRRVRVAGEGLTCAGLAASIGPSGGLIVRTEEGENVEVTSGDVSVRLDDGSYA